MFTNVCLQLCFLEKGKKPHETFHILKMKTPLEKEPHFENENTFQKRIFGQFFISLAHCGPVGGPTLKISIRHVLCAYGGMHTTLPYSLSLVYVHTM